MCTCRVHREKFMETLRANVGRRPHRHCQNLVSDQTTVMTLLSRIPEQFGGAPGTLNFLVRPGFCADDLYQAILRFQKTQVLTLYQPDGIVEPGGATLVYMNRLADLHMPLTKVDLKTQDKMAEVVLDEKLKVYHERADANAPEYARKQEREHNNAVNKWTAWKQRIRRDTHGSLAGNLAIQFLNDEEKRNNANPDLPFFDWAYGFGEAFIGYDYTGGWSREFMLNKSLLAAYDKRKLLVNTHGLTHPKENPVAAKYPAVILFGNFTHFVVEKDKVVEFVRPNP